MIHDDHGYICIYFTTKVYLFVYLVNFYILNILNPKYLNPKSKSKYLQIAVSVTSYMEQFRVNYNQYPSFLSTIISGFRFDGQLDYTLQVLRL